MHTIKMSLQDTDPDAALAWESLRKRGRQLESNIASKVTQLSHLASRIGHSTYSSSASQSSHTTSQSSTFTDLDSAEPSARASALEAEVSDLLSKVRDFGPFAVLVLMDGMCS